MTTRAPRTPELEEFRKEAGGLNTYDMIFILFIYLVHQHVIFIFHLSLIFLKILVVHLGGHCLLHYPFQLQDQLGEREYLLEPLNGPPSLT